MRSGGRFRWAVVAVLLIAAVVGVAVAVTALREARADPVVRRLTVRLPHWPAGAAPVRVALVSDIHLGNRAMDAGRLARIVTQVNRQSPDLVLLAGDFVAGHDRGVGAQEAAGLTAPLSRLRAPLGVVAVLGNHDHWTAPHLIADALRRAGIAVLANSAMQRGPLVVIGMDDAYTGHAHPAAALATARGLAGVPILVTHTPGRKALPPGAPALVLAGHTHCGQVVLPLVGALGNPGLFDPRYRCGAVREPGRLTVVTAGVGTSIAPVRLGAPPDWWLLTLGP